MEWHDFPFLIFVTQVGIQSVDLLKKLILEVASGRVPCDAFVWRKDPPKWSNILA